jgi:hypothetical protein
MTWGSRAVAIALVGLGGAGCRTTVQVDESEWTVERAIDVITRVERAQIEVARRGPWTWSLEPRGIPVYHQSVGIPAADSPDAFPRCDESGFDDFCVFSVVAAPESAESAMARQMIAAMAALGGGTTPAGPALATYGFRRVAFADIERVAVQHGGYPMFMCLLIVGPWFHDIEIDLKGGRKVVLYKVGSIALNLFPVWLVPVHWIGLPESYEYAEAIEFLRLRAARDRGPRPDSGGGRSANPAPGEGAVR